MLNESATPDSTEAFTDTAWHSSPMAVLAFLPTADAKHPLVFRDGLHVAPFVIDPPSEAERWVAHVATALASTSEPLVLIFYGDASVYAPAVGFSRRALRRPAIHYILVNPVLPTIGGDYGDWPDAPITVVLTEDADDQAKDSALQARLRGWTVTSESLATVCANC